MTDVVDIYPDENTVPPDAMTITGNAAVAVAMIDQALAGTTTRSLIPADEYQSLLLDLRLLLA